MKRRAQRPRRELGLSLAKAAARLRLDAVFGLLDGLVVCAAYTAVLVLRFDGAVPPVYWRGHRLFLPVALVLTFVANWVWGLYGHVWREAGIHEARRILAAQFSAGAALALLFLPGRRIVPASIVVLGAAIAAMCIGALRFHARLFAFNRTKTSGQAERVVVLGAGASGAAIVREMLRQPGENPIPVALLDDDQSKWGRRLAGVPVVGGLDALADARARLRPDYALLAIPSADQEVVRRVANAADAARLTLKVLPSVSELVGKEASVRDVRELSILDLLGRQQVATDLGGVRAILQDRRVLITGGGGSIGAEIARQVSACEPAALLLLDHDETHLYESAATLPECTQILADIRDAETMHGVLQRYRPDTVFHAAAHKHVPLLEDHPSEAVLTNVIGTANVLRAARAAEVERFVFISTDKAVNPSSVMGATKLVGEQLLLADAPASGCYCAVRFGNVLGSRGSVIPTFMRQITDGGPVTVTDPRMTRFFMSISEAVQLVLQAAALSRGGEVFMLDMGEPVRIIDLAERMIRLSGRRVGTEIAIRITGPRPGEKLVEELRTPEEEPAPTSHPSIVALAPELLPRTALDAACETLEKLALLRQDDDVAAVLRGLVSATEIVLEHNPVVSH